MKALIVLPIAVTAAVLASSQTKSRHAKKRQLDGVWELVSGQPLPKGARDIKVVSGGHFIFAAYDTENGRPLYTAGGTYILNGNSYTEHMDFASDVIAPGLVGKDQQFTINVDGDSFTQTLTAPLNCFLSCAPSLPEEFRSPYTYLLSGSPNIMGEELQHRSRLGN